MSTHRRTNATVAAAVCAFMLVTLGLVRLSEAGFGASTPSNGGWAAGQVDLTDDDAGTVRFDSATDGLLDGGQTLSRCITVTYTGTLTQDVAVKMYAATAGALAPHLDLTIEDGTGGGFGTCTGFTPARTIFAGTLARFGTDHGTYATGAGRWDPTAPGTARTYRITLTVQNTAAAQAKTATGTFTWEVRSGMAVPPFAPSDLAGVETWLAAKTLPGAPGSQVLSWADGSGTGHDATGTGFSAYRPTLVAGATPAGGRAVRFDGYSQFTFAAPVLGGYRSTASSTYSTRYPGNATDGDPATIWTSGATSGVAWLQVQPRTAFPATGYTLTRKSGDSGQSPTAWTFEGSQDGTTWTVLDTRTGQALTDAAVTYTLGSAVAYRHYRLNITANGGASYTSLAEVRVGGNPAPAATEGEIWAVVRSGGQSNASLWQFGASGTAVKYPDSASGNIIETFGTSAAQTFTPTISPVGWRLYRVSTDGSAWTASLDGVVQHTAGALPARWANDPLLGQSQSGKFIGDVAEVLVRDQVSSPDEVSALIRYFNAEHGLAVPVP